MRLIDAEQKYDYEVYDEDEKDLVKKRNEFR